MVKKFFRKANSLLLAAAMTATLLPAQMISAAETDVAENAIILNQAEERADSVPAVGMDSVTGVECTVIEGNTPVLPKKIEIAAEDGTKSATEVTWAEWDKRTTEGKHTVTGTTADGKTVAAIVNVLPCDEVVADVQAMGRKDEQGGNEQERANAIHSLKGYKGVFVTEYDIVPNNEYSISDRAVIYLPATDSSGGTFDANSAWDYGARLQFKHSYKKLNEKYFFQTQDGDGQVKDNANYYPTDDEIDAAVDRNENIALPFDEKSTYHVRTVMDTATDTTKGNVKIYITDPEGVEHEVTKPGGNGFRIYPTNGIIKNFAVMRGGYRMINHKVSWISGYVTKQTDLYLKGKDASNYAQEEEPILTKELPGVISGQQDAQIVRRNELYSLDTEQSGWFNGDEKVPSVSADDGNMVTYRAYYNYVEAIDKTALNAKVQEVKDLKEEDYTVGSWKTFSEALENAIDVNTSTTEKQATVNAATQKLTTAATNLVNIKNLKETTERLRAELTEKEEHKADYSNWNDVEKAVRNAETVLRRENATKAQVEAAEKGLEISLIPNKKETDKTALNQAIANAKEKNAADYTAASYQNMQTKLTAASAVVANSDATQEEVDKAKNDLLDAINKLVQVTKVASIKPAAKTYKIAAGKKLDLKKVFTVLPENATNSKLTYSIEAKDSKYATVNPQTGVVTVKKNGKGKTIAVKATATDGSGTYGTVKIKIMKNAVTKITVKKKSLTVKAGKKAKINSVVKTNGKNANKVLEYTSSNEKLATVKNGVVTTKKGKTGKVTITIKSTDGTNKSVKVKITIKK